MFTLWITTYIQQQDNIIEIKSIIQHHTAVKRLLVRNNKLLGKVSVRTEINVKMQRTVFIF